MTIKDIARESGYAVGTVSRVLNGQSGVSPQARQKIMEVVQACGFQPNVNARRLKQQVSRGVAILVRGRGNMIFAPIVERMQSLFEARGYGVSPFYLEKGMNEVERARRICRERHPQGIVFLGGERTNFLRDFSHIEIPCVLTTYSVEGLDFPNLSNVCTDDEEAAFQAVEYLLERGHDSIGVLGPATERIAAGYPRWNGCLRAFRKRGRAWEPEDWYEGAEYTYEAAYRAMERLLDRRPEMTAVFAMSDVSAIGAMRCLQDRGKRVPEDISLMGFDGVELGNYLVPRLTTVRQDVERLAVRSAEILLAQIEKGAGAVQERVPFALVSGESVARRG